MPGTWARELGAGAPWLSLLMVVGGGAVVSGASGQEAEQFRRLCVVSSEFLPLSGPQCSHLSNGELVTALPAWGLLGGVEQCHLGTGSKSEKGEELESQK